MKRLQLNVDNGMASHLLNIKICFKATMKTLDSNFDHFLVFTLVSFYVFRKCEINLDYSLPRKSSLSSDSNKTFCMIGHCISSQEELLRLSGRWNLGNLLLFNGILVCFFC